MYSVFFSFHEKGNLEIALKIKLVLVILCANREWSIFSCCDRSLYVRMLSIKVKAVGQLLSVNNRRIKQINCILAK